MAVNLYSRTSFYKDNNEKVIEGPNNVTRTDDCYHDRGRWWLHTIRNTPNPGTYHIPTFIEKTENDPIKKTYGFKSSGRTSNADPSLTGAVLLPGAYNMRDFIQDSARKTMSFGFKNSKRTSLSNQSNECCSPFIGPGSYSPDKTKTSSQRNTSGFVSKSKRFPTIHFKPKEGPSPCQYETNQGTGIRNMPMSAFNSNTLRFTTAHKMNTPGPGAYTKLSYRIKSSPNIHNLGRYHGLFFPCGPGN